MPQKQRLRVWNGELQKTTGGLRKKDLVKNKRGKIVSRRKSAGAGGANNLGKWLRKRGDTFGDKPVALQKEQKKEEKKEQKKVKTPKPVYSECFFLLNHLNHRPPQTVYHLSGSDAMHRIF